VCTVERWWWRRPARAASMAAEETGGVESVGDLESFTMKSEMSQGGLLFIGLKLLAEVLNYNHF
jgi:hypothetical protein